MSADRAQPGSQRQRTFLIEVEDTSAVCAVGEQYAARQLAAGNTPVLSCEGPCIRGEIARQAANRIAEEAGFARACPGEALAVPASGMARWLRESEQVVVLDGCFLRCQGRMMRRVYGPGQLLEIDALPLYRKYTDVFAVDAVPEAERTAVADDVARKVLEQLRAQHDERERQASQGGTPCQQAVSDCSAPQPTTCS